MLERIFMTISFIIGGLLGLWAGWNHSMSQFIAGMVPFTVIMILNAIKKGKE